MELTHIEAKKLYQQLFGEVEEKAMKTGSYRLHAHTCSAGVIVSKFYVETVWHDKLIHKALFSCGKVYVNGAKVHSYPFERVAV